MRYTDPPQGQRPKQAPALLKVPNYINYTVKPGDTLYSIARKNNISIETLEKDNALTSPILRIGQILRIRLQSGSTQEVEECIGPDYTPPENTDYINYTVKKGDNLYNIAKTYNTSVSTIMNINNLNSSNLSIGQVLRIPSNNSNSSKNIYIVQKGDSLYSISKRFNTTVDKIKKDNNLIGNTLSIGQKLII